jgi:hypothetical protein
MNPHPDDGDFSIHDSVTAMRQGTLVKDENPFCKCARDWGTVICRSCGRLRLQRLGPEWKGGSNEAASDK